MKISLAWLKDYVALPQSAEALADLLTNSGTEVVGREERGNIPDKVVVAQILSSEQHPNADRLSVCRVDDGSGQPRQIVCGAKNYKVGDKVPLALPGAVLGPDFKIKSGKLRGVASEGMMCSAKELGMGDDAAGLLILPSELAVGKPLAEVFPSDTVLELEVTPNRPDLLSYLGVTRELGAITGEAARAVQTLRVAEKAADDFLRLEDSACPFYTARILRGVKIGPSPQWLADRLRSVGLRPINNVVDVTNYVLMETGQPLHAFDLARLDGGIVVRRARDGETLRILDGTEVKLRTQDLVIADARRVVALAGVMGGLETGTTEASTYILLESAWFEPTCVRRTSRELGLVSDSSYRFERRVDAAGVLSASARAVELILQMAGGTADAEVLVAGSAPSGSAEIVLDNEHCRALLGCDIADEEIAEILQRLGLVKSGNVWIVPSYRPDLTREVDLIEEVIRMAGIHRVPSRLRGFPAEASGADLRHDNAERIREHLRAQGFSEARTSHFVSPEVLRRSGGAVEGAVEIRNPLGADQALLRPVLLAGLLGAVERNVRHGVEEIRLFELGRIFQAGDGERTALALVSTGGECDFYGLKGALQSALGSMEFHRESAQALRVFGGGVEGALKRLPRALAEGHEAKEPVFYAEVLLDELLEAPLGETRVRALPKYPSVQRDLTLVLPGAVAYAEVEAALRGARAPHLCGVGFKDSFVDKTGEKLSADRRAVTVALTFRDDERTLTSDEVDRAVDTLRGHAKAELGAEFRE